MINQLDGYGLQGLLAGRQALANQQALAGQALAGQAYGLGALASFGHCGFHEKTIIEEMRDEVNEYLKDWKE